MPFSHNVQKSKSNLMTPSTTKVLNILRSGKPMTATELKERSGYSIRTVYYSLKPLLEQGLVHKKINLMNIQTTEYQIASLTRASTQKETAIARINTEKLKTSIAKVQEFK
ncbi:MAG: helix-turn-helix transcriptional regulator [Candidatus Heimdallarchaeota archaeon]|nr:MAG: helix-turn-helix transcriptional regulator [Candidatus Heimdallarchaeota archaeon]